MDNITVTCQIDEKTKNFLNNLPNTSTAELFEIDSDNMMVVALEEIKIIKSKQKKLDELRKSITKPLDEAKKNIMGLFKPAIEYLKNEEKILKSKVLSYEQEQEEKKRKEEERIKKLQEKNNAENPTIPVTIISKENKVEGVTKYIEWKFRIVDENLIPREYLVVDETKIRKVVTALKDQTKIPGVEVYPEETLRVRS